MKKVFLFLAAAMIGLSACKTQSGGQISKKAQEFYNEHCAKDSKIEKRPDGKYSVRLHCVNLHDTAAVNKYINGSKVCYSPTSAEAELVGISSDSIPDIWAITKAIAKGVKK